MGAGVARQCSENRCLARWTVWIPHRGRRGGAGRANSKKDLVTGPIQGSCALHDAVLEEWARESSATWTCPSCGAGPVYWAIVEL